MTATNSDLTPCDKEVIHTPGSIQPFGVLLAFDAHTLTVSHASANSGDVYGPGAAVRLGSTAAELLGGATAAALREALAGDGLSDPGPLAVSLPGTDARRWHAVAHRLGDKVFVELEPTDATAASPTDVLAAVRVSIGKLSAAATLAEFGAVVAREVRALTGYDRVMVYQFDHEYNGAVVAEERRADLEAFLGLHYPASDIPSQARALFLLNRLRVIPDAAGTPIPVVPARDGRTGLPLDLSRCLLRSVAPVHREYLHNMEVRASLTASLVVGGRLWGLIACHHLTPNLPSPAAREACDLLAQVAGVHLAFLAEVEQRAYLATLSGAVEKIGILVGQSSPPIAALAKDAAVLLALVGAAGAAVLRSGRTVRIGQTPPEEAFPGLVGWVKGVAVPLLATDRLPQAYAPAKQFAEVASGLLALELSRDTDEYVLWFRPEVQQTVNWGGNPHGKSGPDGRLSPRRSFALWEETVRDRSLPWQSAALENARKVRELLFVAAARSAVRLEAFLPICAWCHKVRDEPDYWRGVEEFIRDLVDVRFTHGICPECLDKQLEGIADYRGTSRSSS